MLLRRILPPGVLNLLVKPSAPETAVKSNLTPVAAMQQQQQRPQSGDSSSDPAAWNPAHASSHGTVQPAAATRAPDTSVYAPTDSSEGAEGASATRRKVWMDFFQALESDHLVSWLPCVIVYVCVCVCMYVYMYIMQVGCA